MRETMTRKRENGSKKKTHVPFYPNQRKGELKLCYVTTSAPRQSLMTTTTTTKRGLFCYVVSVVVSPYAIIFSF